VSIKVKLKKIKMDYSNKSQTKRLFTLCLAISNTLGGLCYSPCVFANNSAGNETIKFQVNQITKTNVTNDENQTAPTEDDKETADAYSRSSDLGTDFNSDTSVDGSTKVTLAQPAPEAASGNLDSPPYISEARPVSSAPVQSAPESISENVDPARPSVKTILQGQAVYTVPSGTPVKLKMASVPTHALKMMDRDIEGNLYPARLGQPITARTTEDIYIGTNKIIPEGTIFSGKVSQIFPPRRVGRPGSLALSFDRLTTPDGRIFAFRVEADNHKASTYKTKAKGFGIIAYHAFGGAVVGALVAYEIFGWQNTLALHGYNIAAGAAAGALIATGYAIMRKGPQATLVPGDDLNMCIDQDLLMPIAVTVPEKKVISESLGLTMHVEKSKIVNDGLDEHFVTVDLTATNEGDKELSSIDLFLEDTNQERHPVSVSPDEDSQFLFHLEPHSTRQLHVSFLTQYPKLKQKLVWVDHETKVVLASEKL